MSSKELKTVFFRAHTTDTFAEGVYTPVHLMFAVLIQIDTKNSKGREVLTSKDGLIA